MKRLVLTAAVVGAVARLWFSPYAYAVAAYAVAPWLPRRDEANEEPDPIAG